MTLASPMSSSVSWLGSATWRDMSNPRASRSGDSSSKSHRARRAWMVAEAYALTTWEDATMGLARGCPCTEMPYSTSVPITRRTLMRRAYAVPPSYSRDMGLWTEHVVPRLTDASLSTVEVNRYRVEACAGLKGRVLEIGFGSGLNLPHLPPGVTAVDVVEPNEVAWVRSAQRRRATEIPVQRIGL